MSKGARMPAMLPKKFSKPVQIPTSSGGAQHWRITSKFPVASPTRDPPIIRRMALLALAACAAGMTSKPVEKASVTIPLRVRVSFQPTRIRRSAIHPPIGSLTPKTKKGSEE